MSDVNNKAVADLLDQISEAFMALAGSFRGGSAGGKSGGGNGKAGGKGKSKPAKSDDDADDEVTEDTLREALKALALSHGKDTMVAVMAEFDAETLADISEDDYAKVMERVTEESEKEAEAPAPKSKPAAKKPAAKGKAKKVTLEQVQDAAKALIEADKPAYMKLVKKLGKPSEMDEDAYADALKALTDAMPAAEEEEEDLL